MISSINKDLRSKGHKLTLEVRKDTIAIRGTFPMKNGERKRMYISTGLKADPKSPPLAEMDIEPSLEPLQVRLLVDNSVITTGSNSVITTDIESIQPLISVTVTLYIPAVVTVIAAEGEPLSHS